MPVSFPSDSVLDVLLRGSAGEAELLCPHWKVLCGAQEQIIPAGIFSRVLNCFKLGVSVPRLEEDGVKCYSYFCSALKKNYEIHSLHHSVDIDRLFS